VKVSIDCPKIKFPLADDSGGIEAEWMWTKTKDGLYELDNSPFHAYGVSYKDLVSARLAEDGSLEFEQVVKKCGHRTVRIRFPRTKDHSDFEAIWSPLSALGCTFEGSQIDRPVYAIDLPPGTDLAAVVGYLARLEGTGLLQYEEADT
jgi:hypothetical protein